MSVSVEDLRENLTRLRDLYVSASPNQRYQVAMNRLEYPDAPPNMLITHVSGVEGFARAIALDFAVASGESVDVAYGRLRNVVPVALIRDHICTRIRRDPETLFGKPDWELFELAVQYRNLLIHEATFLSQNHSPPLIAACRRVTSKLREIANV